MLKPTLCLAALILTLSLYGQGRKLSYAVYAGPVFATIKPDPEGVLDPKFRAGFFAGASLRWSVSERWVVPIDVQFSQRGFYYHTRGTPILVNNQLTLYKGRADYKLSYLDLIPQLEFRPFRYVGIAVGPYFSWRMGEAIRFGDVVDWTSTKDDNIFSDTDLGLSGRLSGYLGPVSLSVSYHYGLSNMSNIELVDENGQALGRLKAKSRAITVGAGYEF